MSKFGDLEPIGCMPGILLTVDLLGQIGRVYPEGTGTMNEDTSQSTFASLQKVGGYSMVKDLPVGSHQQNSVTQYKCNVCDKIFVKLKSLSPTTESFMMRLRYIVVRSSINF